jgi:hypothetical protein
MGSPFRRYSTAVSAGSADTIFNRPSSPPRNTISSKSRGKLMGLLLRRCFSAVSAGSGNSSLKPSFRPKDTISSKPGENYVHSPFRVDFPTYPVITIFKEPSSLPRSTISSMSRENLWTYAFGRVSLDVPSPLELDSRI